MNKQLSRRDVLITAVAVASASIIPIPARADVPTDHTANLRALDEKWHCPETYDAIIRGNSMAPAYPAGTIIRFQRVDRATVKAGRCCLFRWRDDGNKNGWEYRESFQKVRHVTPKYLVLSSNTGRRRIMVRSEVFYAAMPVAERRWVSIG
jgi:hypothetical protein